MSVKLRKCEKVEFGNVEYEIQSHCKKKKKNHTCKLCVLFPPKEYVASVYSSCKHMAKLVTFLAIDFACPWTSFERKSNPLPTWL